MKTLAIDFDGVIHAYTQGWQDGSAYDIPVAGALDSLRKLSVNYALYILSTRDPAQIQEWLQKHAPELKTEIITEHQTFWEKRGIIGISRQKIAAIAYIDDRGLRFTNWPDIRKYFA